MRAKHAVGLTFRYGEGKYSIIKIRKLPKSNSHIYEVADANGLKSEFHEDAFEHMWRDYKAKLLVACGFTLDAGTYTHRTTGQVFWVMTLNEFKDNEFLDFVEKYHNVHRACTNCKHFLLNKLEACNTCAAFSHWEEYWI